MGSYLDIPEDYEPNMEELDLNDIQDWEDSVESGHPYMLHYWVEVGGYIVDITADQFHRDDPEDYWVVVEPKSSMDYKVEHKRR